MRPDDAWIVTADGLRVGGPFDDREDAEGFAATWNSAYPPPEHTEFVIEQIAAEEAKHLDRRAGLPDVTAPRT